MDLINLEVEIRIFTLKLTDFLKGLLLAELFLKELALRFLKRLLCRHLFFMRRLLPFLGLLQPCLHPGNLLIGLGRALSQGRCRFLKLLLEGSFLLLRARDLILEGCLHLLVVEGLVEDFLLQVSLKPGDGLLLSLVLVKQGILVLCQLLDLPLCGFQLFLAVPQLCLQVVDLLVFGG